MGKWQLRACSLSKLTPQRTHCWASRLLATSLLQPCLLAGPPYKDGMPVLLSVRMWCLYFFLAGRAGENYPPAGGASGSGAAGPREGDEGEEEEEEELDDEELARRLQEEEDAEHYRHMLAMAGGGGWGGGTKSVVSRRHVLPVQDLAGAAAVAAPLCAFRCCLGAMHWVAM
jgi:hypothetical protein